jgi:hypothetical protein
MIEIRVKGTPAPQGGPGRHQNTGRFVKRHGAYGTPEYSCWIAMRKRCYNISNASYMRYGGRGISICERWQRFENFLVDMGLRPSTKHSLDRIDNNGNYEPGNCRWATNKQQQVNRNSVRLLTFKGEALPLSDWSVKLRIPRATIRQRLDNGWTVERALTQDIDLRRSKSACLR